MNNLTIKNLTVKSLLLASLCVTSFCQSAEVGHLEQEIRDSLTQAQQQGLLSEQSDIRIEQGRSFSVLTTTSSINPMAGSRAQLQALPLESVSRLLPDSFDDVTLTTRD
ncbi:hypothetical protein [Shewanella litorisediminis]|uniref:TonB-dependent receptor n=1 Tax=Shewanella litorisediminis TaxID=1173586 RepID=A0ABX7G396_9GAMM|nr:hypothetical protein [Shewanella litorisediminis]MCL2917325.1 hypothetical protein [Shewanella litorisediminis]QRH01794.1 hypothetical protein JQC75_18435 [Shewanella litorisediminis]